MSGERPWWTALIGRQFVLFGLIGVVNTGVHSAVVVGLVEGGLTTPVPANVAAFFLANVFSFFANSRCTFRVAPSLTLYRRFLTVSLTTLGLTVALSGLAEWMEWHYLVGLLLVIVLGPVLAFVMHKTYAFGAAGRARG